MGARRCRPGGAGGDGVPVPQVLPPAEVLPLQHRRVQPVPAGWRRQLPLQQTPEGKTAPPGPPDPWVAIVGWGGEMPWGWLRGSLGTRALPSPCHLQGNSAGIKPGVPSEGNRAQSKRPGGPASPWGHYALFGGGSWQHSAQGPPPQHLLLPPPLHPGSSWTLRSAATASWRRERSATAARWR